MENLPLVTESLEAIPEEWKENYEEKDGKFNLRNGAAAVRAKNREKQASQEKDIAMKALEDRLKTIESQRQEEQNKLSAEKERLEMEAAKKSGDWTNVEKSYQDKLEQAAKDKESALSEANGIISKLTVGQASQQLANDLFGKNASLMLPHIQSRLQPEINGTEAIVRVLDETGKPSALTIDELKTEFQNKSEFAPFILGSEASGGGSNGGSSRGGSANSSKTFKGDLSTAKASDLVAHINAKNGSNLK